MYFLEQRGYGYSEGKLAEPDLVYIDSFDTYVEDLNEFVTKVIKQESAGLPLIMLSHSMGGAIGALYLESYPDVFKAAVFSSPMLKMNTGGMSRFKINLVKVYMLLMHKQKSLSPGQKRFATEPDFENSSALSKARFDYVFKMRVSDYHYQTFGASLGWVMAALDSEKKILENAYKIKIPVVLIQAGMDSLVMPRGVELFMQKVPQARKLMYEDSKHEIFNAHDDVRKKYFNDVLEELNSFL